jgi:hypothetical protein
LRGHHFEEVDCGSARPKRVDGSGETDSVGFPDKREIHKIPPDKGKKGEVKNGCKTESVHEIWPDG